MDDLFLCTECNRSFYDPKIIYGERLEHFGYPCREQYYESPCCGAPFVKAYICKECGLLYKYEDMFFDVCNDCSWFME